MGQNPAGDELPNQLEQGEGMGNHLYNQQPGSHRIQKQMRLQRKDFGDFATCPTTDEIKQLQCSVWVMHSCARKALVFQSHFPVHLCMHAYTSVWAGLHMWMQCCQCMCWQVCMAVVVSKLLTGCRRCGKITNTRLSALSRSAFAVSFVCTKIFSPHFISHHHILGFCPSTPLSCPFCYRAAELDKTLV